MNVRGPDNCDLCTGAIERRRNVINFREVRRTKRVELAARTCELWNYTPSLVCVNAPASCRISLLGKLFSEAIPATIGCQRGRYLWITHIGLTRFTICEETVNLRVERNPYLPDVPGKFNCRSTRRQLDIMKSVGDKPRLHYLDVGIRRAELLPELLPS